MLQQQMLSFLRARASGPLARRVIAKGVVCRQAVPTLQSQSIRNFKTTSGLLSFDPDIDGKEWSHRFGPRRQEQPNSGFQPRGSRDSRPPFNRDDRPRFSRDGRVPSHGNPRVQRNTPMRGKKQTPATAQVNDEVLEGTAEKRSSYTTEFADLAKNDQVSPVLVDTITKDMGFQTMTPVQSQTIKEALDGIDLIAQARTGTGKTLAFIVPILQNLLSKDETLARRQSRRHKFKQDPDIRALILSPTRELAEQIAAEARRLVANTSITVQTAVGGTGKRESMYKIMYEGCHLLIGTPGRVKDVFSDPLYDLNLSNVNTFVLDEADRLLDDGFLPEIQEIASFLPAKERRQNMLFSATVPREVLDLSDTLLNKNHRFVQTIPHGEQQTHEKITQKLVALNGLENQPAALLEFAVKQVASDRMPFKALVFLNSTSETKFYHDLFRSIGRDHNSPLGRRFPAFEIHSKLSQTARSHQAECFRRAKVGVMFTSDVSARGMDYPNVSHVIQLGLPRSRDYYIHRVGRTGRAEQKGEAWIFLSPYEIAEAQTMLRGLRLEKDQSIACAQTDMHFAENIDPDARRIIDTVREGGQGVSPMSMDQAMQGCYGYNSWVRDQSLLVESLENLYMIALGNQHPPELSRYRSMGSTSQNAPSTHGSRQENGGRRRYPQFYSLFDRSGSRFGQTTPVRQVESFDLRDQSSRTSERGRYFA